MTNTDQLNHKIRNLIDHKIGLILLSQARLNTKGAETMSDNHLPWKNEGFMGLVINNANGDTICACPGSSSGKIDEIQANAELIVRAVNNHNTLIDTLRHVHNELNDHYDYDPDTGEAPFPGAGKLMDDIGHLLDRLEA